MTSYVYNTRATESGLPAGAIINFCVHSSMKENNDLDFRGEWFIINFRYK